MGILAVRLTFTLEPTRRGGGVGLQPPSTNQNTRNANSVDIFVLNILCDLLFSWN
jgi:hypothetical protein